MLACMEETKRTFMTGSEGMPTLAKSQVRTLIMQSLIRQSLTFYFVSLQIKVAMKQQVTAKDNEQSSKIQAFS